MAGAYSGTGLGTAGSGEERDSENNGTKIEEWYSGI